MARVLQVKRFNNLMELKRNYTYIMTLGNGSMVDEPRKNGWVVFELPSLGDEHDYAKWYSTKSQALMEYRSK